MAENGKGNIPIIGAAKPRLGVNFTAFVRSLDKDGTFAADRVVQTPAGTVAGPARNSYVTAEELVEMIRIVVRDELAVRDQRVLMED